MRPDAGARAACESYKGPLVRAPGAGGRACSRREAEDAAAHGGGSVECRRGPPPALTPLILRPSLLFSHLPYFIQQSLLIAVYLNPNAHTHERTSPPFPSVGNSFAPSPPSVLPNLTSTNAAACHCQILPCCCQSHIERYRESRHRSGEREHDLCALAQQASVPCALPSRTPAAGCLVFSGASRLTCRYAKGHQRQDRAALHYIPHCSPAGSSSVTETLNALPASPSAPLHWPFAPAQLKRWRVTCCRESKELLTWLPAVLYFFSTTLCFLA